MLEQKDAEVEKPTGRKRKQYPITILIVAVTALFSVGLIFTVNELLKNRENNLISGVKKETLSQKPVIGGPFSLIDQNGKRVSEKDFLGKYMIIFFGYTYCPDFCPTALTNLSDALDLLGDNSKKLTPVFITVDPVRDTVKQLKEYVKYFHPSLRALTGTEKEIKAVKRAYRVYSAKSTGTKNDPEDYLIDHSAITYLIGPDGKFLAHFSHGLEPEVLAKRINENL